MLGNRRGVKNRIAFCPRFPVAAVPMSAFQKAKPAFLVHPLGREVADEPGDGQIVRDAALNDRLDDGL
jgi:hypothetical protein